MSVFKKFQGKRIKPDDPNWDLGRWYVWKRCGNIIVHRALKGAYTEADAKEAERTIVQGIAGKLDRRFAGKVAAKLNKSLAAQRPTNYVYILESGGYYKIGKTTDIVKRVREISKTIIPFDTRVVCVMLMSDASECETFLHRRFAEQRERGEWFALTEEQLFEVKRQMLLFSNQNTTFATNIFKAA